MCLFNQPKMSTQKVETPAALPPPVEEAPKVETIDFGGSATSTTEDATGVKGEKATGRGSLKVSRSNVNSGMDAKYSIK